MISLNRKSILWKFLVLTNLSSIIFLIIMGTIFLTKIEKDKHDSFNAKMEIMLKMIEKSTEIFLWNLEYESLENFVKDIVSDTDIISLKIEHEFGPTISSFDLVSSNIKLIERVEDIIHVEKKIGHFVVQYSTRRMEKELLIDSLIMMLMIFGSLAILSVILYYISKKTVKPVYDLMKAAKNMTDGNLECQVKISSYDEIGELAIYFDEMRESLKKKIKQHEDEIKFRLKIEKSVTESLLEKEILLREVYHRVKNNLQVISSIISLQVGQADDAKFKKLLIDIICRVRSIALVHELLYGTDKLSEINFRDYIHKLSSYLISSFHINPSEVRFDINVRDVCFPITTAVPCGLIINELLTNALKHSFPSDQPVPDEGFIVTVVFFLDDNGNYVLEICDNGIDFPESFDINKSKKMGLILVQDLVGQLQGKIELKKNKTIKIMFKT